MGSEVNLMRSGATEQRGAVSAQCSCGRHSASGKWISEGSGPEGESRRKAVKGLFLRSPWEVMRTWARVVAAIMRNWGRMSLPVAEDPAPCPSSALPLMSKWHGMFSKAVKAPDDFMFNSADHFLCSVLGEALPGFLLLTEVTEIFLSHKTIRIIRKKYKDIFSWFLWWLRVESWDKSNCKWCCGPKSLLYGPCVWLCGL